MRLNYRCWTPPYRPAWLSLAMMLLFTGIALGQVVPPIDPNPIIDPPVNPIDPNPIINPPVTPIDPNPIIDPPINPINPVTPGVPILPLVPVDEQVAGYDPFAPIAQFCGLGVVSTLGLCAAGLTLMRGRRW